MNRLVVCAITVLVVGAVACSSSTDNGQDSGLGTFDSQVMTVDSSPVLLHVFRNPADTLLPSNPKFKVLPFYVSGDTADRTPTVTILPQNTVVPNGNDNIAPSFSTADIAFFDFEGDFLIEGNAPGTTVLTYTLTDRNHNNATQLINIPVTVVVEPVPARFVH